MANIKTYTRPCPHCGETDGKICAEGFDYEYRTCDNNFTFLRCKRCGIVYLNPMPEPGEQRNIYPPDYKPFHFHEGRKDIIYAVRDVMERRKASFYKTILPRKDARILDVGCGDGRYLSIIKKISGPAWRLEGVDFGEEAVERARARGLEVTLGAYETLGLGKSSYDLIIVNQVLEHFSDPAGVIDKIYSELKSGGYLSIETPSLDGWDAGLFHRSFWGGYHFPRHATLFNERTLKIFLESRGFEIVQIRYLLSPVFWVFSWHHAWQSSIRFGAGLFSDTNPLALALAAMLDMFQRSVRNKTSNMQVIARKKG